jgi:hypothetical protein
MLRDLRATELFQAMAPGMYADRSARSSIALSRRDDFYIRNAEEAKDRTQVRSHKTQRFHRSPLLVDSAARDQ